MALRKRIVKSKSFKSLAKKIKKKPGANDYIRPARYGSILQFGAKALKARHYLERAYSRSAGDFTNILTGKLREQLSSMMNKK